MQNHRLFEKTIHAGLGIQNFQMTALTPFGQQKRKRVYVFGHPLFVGIQDVWVKPQTADLDHGFHGLRATKDRVNPGSPLIFPEAGRISPEAETRCMGWPNPWNPCGNPLSALLSKNKVFHG